MWGLAHVSTAREPLYSFGRAFGAHWAFSWALWSPPEALLRTPSALLERPRCNFGVFQAYSFKQIDPYLIPHQPAFGNTGLLSCVLYYEPTSLRDKDQKPQVDLPESQALQA